MFTFWNNLQKYLILERLLLITIKSYCYFFFFSQKGKVIIINPSL